MFKEPWKNAGELVRKKEIVKPPWNANMRIVPSLTNPATPHIVQGTNMWKTVKCDCKGFEVRGLCAHVLAVAKIENTLATVIGKWQPSLTKQVRAIGPKQAGQKPGPKRTRHQPLQRNVSDYGKRTKTDTPQQDTMFEVINVSKCKATTCYGCGAKFRKKASDPPPAAPWDILLRRKEYRVYRGENNALKISAKLENVYYHVTKACVLKKVELINRDQIVIPEHIHLQRLHKEQLTKEFGCVFA